MRLDKTAHFTRLLLLIALLVAAKLASPSVFAQEKTEQAFQAIPRNSDAECSAAQKKLTAKMTSLGFTDIVSGCATLNDDTGSHPIPILQGKHSSIFSGDTAMGSRRATREDCLADLKTLTPKGSSITLMESDCIKGTETDWRGSTTDFWQAYVFYLWSESGSEDKDPANPIIFPSVSDSTKGKDLPLDEHEKAKRNFINSSKTLPR